MGVRKLCHEAEASKFDLSGRNSLLPPNDHYRTNRVNAVFELSRSLSMNYDKRKKGIKDHSVILSPSVAGVELEPTTFGL